MRKRGNYLTAEKGKGTQKTRAVILKIPVLNVDLKGVKKKGLPFTKMTITQSIFTYMSHLSLEAEFYQVFRS